MKIREKIARFMYGRYGIDELGRFLNTLLMILIFLNIFLRSRVLDFLFLALIIFEYSRIFSKNYLRCSAQNQWFLNKTQGIRSKLWKQQQYQAMKKNYRIYKCKKCGQKIRIPKGKGKIIVTCPKCGNEFQKRS